MQSVRYADLMFQPDMLSATRDDGTVLRLTRQERALILHLSRQPHKLITRAQLLEGLGDLAGELGERNVDYLVNRLRKRLGDNARAPRFIATQYGEGYLWVADAVAAETVSAFMLIGPVYGLAQDAGPLGAIVERLAKHVGSALGDERKVLCMPQWRFEQGAAGTIGHSLEVSLLSDEEQVHMALVLRDGGTNSPIAPFRITLPGPSRTADLEVFAQSLVQSIWAHAALPDGQPPEPTDRPLHLRLHDAALLVSAGCESWRENAPRLAEGHAANPDDPTIAVLRALNRYAQLVLAPFMPETPPLTDAEWLAIEDEMERLVLGALPQAGGKPMLLMGIAKVLRFLDRGHLQLACRLTDEAFLTSTAFAAAFAMKGQIHASQGDIERAIELYDRAIELSKAGSQFHIYLLVIKGTALLAADRRGDIAQLTAELHALDPASRLRVGLFFLPPKARLVPAVLKPVLAAVTMTQGQRMLMYLYRISARQFARRHHQKNVLLGLSVHLVNMHGAGVIPPELKTRFPDLAARQGNAQKRYSIETT
ncbi:DNA-binding winged helix-turn-helix (wHTH) protein [Mesorhizobium soli]|uniref:winged helix-turn-helix domain-containing protein n=1 Tax=Pseudaminobacter soli (ex Li et al. 2025) TaxID=1295366 RepID=UPI0024747DC5|nr:winged helix-turn-helix domain-containing protein [Mesorhizobium soli]MDH6231767.1 DNA-binding winged helix-turn-helix (wHTH) protein [Mesorhizobium soli]